MSVIVTLVAVACLSVGATDGRFSSTRQGSANGLSGGGVAVATSPPRTCTFTGMWPDGTAHTCQVQATYTGLSNAWAGLDIFVATSHAGTTGTNLYDPSGGANKPAFALTSTSPTATFAMPTSTLTCPGAATSMNGQDFTGYNACYQVNNELLSTSSLVTSTTTTYSTSVTVPVLDPSGYQGGSAVVVVRPHAVQAINNGTASGCIAGAVCATITSWS